jgi:class 3 adenylate cyclase/tetratricopeptide (TPR) repeat protein
MLCLACGAQNPSAGRFCGSCGVALPTACPQCDHPNPRTNRFCAECGGALAAPALAPPFASPQQYTPRQLAEKILSSRAAMEGERKQVTVLFADVAGFTSMADRLDPEDCHAIMRRCFDLMLAEVHRYEGTVSHFLGDGIMALFGAPIAREDHAQSAVRAALGIQHALRVYQQELQEAQGIRFRMRVGLNSGLVVVGTIGSDLSMTYTAIGDTVNLASRVQGLAEPGTVVISEQTQRLVSGYFVTHDLGEHPVKGIEQAVRVYEVVRPSRFRSRLAVSAEGGLSPFVGRQQDRETLLDRWASARAGSGQIVFVRGEPGIGKSRLLYEFERCLEGEELTWLEGRCISYGRDIAYFPVIDLLKDRFEIQETDTAEEIAQKVDAEVRVLGAAMAAHTPYLKYLLAVDPGNPAVATMDAQLRKVYLFEAMRALLLETAARRPLVVLLEDLHWIDPLSEEFLSYIADTVPHHPFLLVLTHRSEYEQRFGSRPYLTTVDLQSLSEPECAEVARGLLGAASMPIELQHLIYQKGEGNPFFVEEVTKSLLEVGAIRRTDSRYVLARRLEEIVVPDTVQDVIMARLDRLPEEPKRALQIASVIGREFTMRLLERTAELPGHLEEYLRELKGVELIYERSLYPELAYMFKHALTHDVAYSSLLLARRRELHRLVGDAIEALYADRLSEQYETVAHHYERAEEWDKALDYLLKSGDKALASFAPQQAVAFYDRTLAVLEKSSQPLGSELAIGLHFHRGQALFLINDWDRSAASFQAMLQAAQKVGNRAREGEALHQIAYTYYWGHRLEEALDYAEQARRLALETNDQATLAGSLATISGVYQVTGDLSTARKAAEEALQVARQTGIPALQAAALLFVGEPNQFQGDPGRAIEQFDEALQIAREHQVPDLLLYSLYVEGLAHCAGGRYDHALRYLKEEIDLSARLGDKIWRCRALNTIGWVYMDLCHWDLAIQYNGQGAAEARAVGDPEIIRNAELNLADCYLALARMDEAQRTLETVHQECQQSGAWGEEWMKWRYTQHLNASLGELWLARGDTEQALTFADACLATAEATVSRRNIVKGRRLKGEAFLAQGRLAEAETELEEALRVAREVGNPAQLWKTLAAQARLRQAQARPEDAAIASQEVLAIVESVAAGLDDPALRDTFLASPQVSALREAAAVK